MRLRCLDDALLHPSPLTPPPTRPPLCLRAALTCVFLEIGTSASSWGWVP